VFLFFLFVLDKLIGHSNDKIYVEYDVLCLGVF